MDSALKKKAVVGLSGGVDSCVAALLLKEQGFEVAGATLRLVPGDGAEIQIRDARLVADALGIELKVYDLREEFKQKIMDYFVNEYLNGATPNPCTVCNPEIKFGALMDAALSEGADCIATGHYAKVEEVSGRWLLKKAGGAKDQSYFLYALNQHQLSRAVFPLGDMEKPEVRQIAEQFHLPVAY